MSAINHALIGSSASGVGPTVPLNLYGVVGDDAITLYWTDSNREIGYQLERSSDNITFSQIGTTNQNQTSYLDVIGIFPSTTYYYRVRATDGVNFSNYSNTATVTTPSRQSTVFLGSNSYLTFGFGSSVWNGVSYSNPFGPKILVSGADNSYQRVYELLSGTEPNRTYRIRYEGTSSTGGTAGSPNMVWEAVFYELTSNTIDLHIGINARSPFGASGVCDSSALVTGFANGVVNTAYQIVTFPGPAATVTPITLSLNGPDGMNMMRNGSWDDDNLRLNIPWYVDYLGGSY